MSEFNGKYLYEKQYRALMWLTNNFSLSFHAIEAELSGHKDFDSVTYQVIEFYIKQRVRHSGYPEHSQVKPATKKRLIKNADKDKLKESML